MTRGAIAGIHPDLHMHSAFSDGLHLPDALCAMIEKAGLTHFSLCDHDTLAGITPMQDAANAMNRRRAGEGKPSLVFLPGVELSTGPTGMTHVLGYGARPDNRRLGQWLCGAQQRRQQRFDQMRSTLAHLGFPIPEALLPIGTGAYSPGRAHLARALIRMGAVNTLRQAFDRYLGEGRPAYVPYAHMSTREAIRFLRKAHIVPVLAHPARLRMSEEALFALVASLQEAGLMGLEVFHPSASSRQVRSFEAFARRRKLLVAGGSDFHGDADTSVALGKLPPGWTHASHDLAMLIFAINAA